MGFIIYGTKTFTKFEGYYGDIKECESCSKAYKKAYVKYTTWAHLNEIPLFPIKKSYNVICPICGHGYSLKGKDAKMEMNNKDDNQNIKIYAKHILSKKPKKILDPDMSYELYAKDLVSGEETLIATNISKDVVKSFKKDRGIKKLEIIDV